MNHRNWHKKIEGSMREIVFGLEDSLVTSLGTVTGIAVGTHNTYVVLLSGVVVIFTSVMSMSAGSYLSSKSADGTKRTWFRKNNLTKTSVRAGVVMGASYLLGGFIPLFPYLFLSTSQAILPSVLLTALVLLCVGIWSAHYTKRSPLRSGLEMVFISLGAALIGYVIGQIANLLF